MVFTLFYHAVEEIGLSNTKIGLFLPKEQYQENYALEFSNDHSDVGVVQLFAGRRGRY
jgi:hypothetical protein